MEWIFALGATATAIAYAVLLGRGIERRQRWALEMARAISALDGCSAERYLRDCPIAVESDTAAAADEAADAEPCCSSLAA
ncbi:MAG: hypothetical protein H6993_15850 [Pseudomonadales bacterium]|nr:hypothetical protein [Pseudomonadales bacterium]